MTSAYSFVLNHVSLLQRVILGLDVVLLFAVLRSRRIAYLPSSRVVHDQKTHDGGRVILRPARGINDDDENGAKADCRAFEVMWEDYCRHFGADGSMGASVFDRMRREGGLVLAEVNGRVVGFATFIQIEHTFSSTLYLEDLYVMRSARSAGVGRALIEWTRKVAVKRGCKRLYWHALKDADARYLYARVANLTNLVRYQIDL